MPNLIPDMNRPLVAPGPATRARAARLLILVLLLSVGGCFSLSRGALPPQHYVLGAGGSPAAVDRGAVDRLAADRPAEAAGPDVVGLRLPRLADYLATPFIVVRSGDHQVEFTEYHRWGEDLGSAINRTVAGLLAERAPSHRVVTAPWPGGAPPAQVIQLQILRFEGTAPGEAAGVTGATGATGVTGATGATGQAHLLATWEILRASDGSLLARGTTEVREDGWTVGDFAGLVRLLDRGLARLADDLARNLDMSLPSP